MKSFRQLIRWELEQERRTKRPLQSFAEEMSDKLNASMARKMRQLSSTAAHQDVSPRLHA